MMRDVVYVNDGADEHSLRGRAGMMKKVSEC
jgi:hypothetical protein